MTEFRYSAAERCTWCSMRAVLPSEDAADRIVAASGGRLMKYRCPVDDGWHLSYPATEHATLIDPR
ncbi:hypothetical protein SAMN06265360_12053 [Haloechinothrix alba]|uniref:Uncharacterized protein n=2 Tax=Haloechinothrix TaxID=1425377 RepID=A0A238ZCM8_9PSEU|nr:hypothetical protein [Haloechinothrix alba]SNR80523.1 hypothetical protein SAMN06265360_12053 [Haloechinothrix alba]